jgi:hypothetical protein
MADRVMIENANHPGSSTSVDAGMSNAMRDALLEVLPATAPGMTETQMRGAVLPKLPADLYPGGARAGWWSKAVQLDLEAKGVIKRETSRPLRWHHPAEGSGGEARIIEPRPPRDAANRQRRGGNRAAGGGTRVP